MTRNLDPRGLEAAHEAYIERLPFGMRDGARGAEALKAAIGDAITAYLEATPSPATGEVAELELGSIIAELGRIQVEGAKPGHVYAHPFHVRRAAKQAADALTTLSAERDEATELLGRAAINMPERMRTAGKLPENITALRARLTAAEARAERRRVALEPFAEAAANIDDDVPDRAEMWEHPASMCVTAGDFRAARAALEE